MPTSLIMTVLGPDRPGLVRALADVVKEHDGSWLESRMTRLAGQFAGVVRVECPAEKASTLAAALTALNTLGLTVQTILEATGPAPQRTTLRVEVTGNDRPGIVSDLTAAIASAGGNVEELVTGLESAPMSGHPLFRASGVVSLPTEADTGLLVTAIERLSGDLTVDVQ
jgi:glycine cleavage system regulatory protein